MANLGHMWLTAAILSSMAAPLAGGALGVDAPNSGSLQEYARELNDPRLDVREAATARLAADDTVKTDDIVDFVSAQQETLSPEAIERFMIASRERFIANPGAIGIQFGDSSTAIIQTVIAGTPASRVLQRGDQFLLLNGEALPETRTQQQPELLRRMAGYKAGDLVTARIRRGSEEIDVEFALADPRTLPRFEDFIVQMQREMAMQWEVLREKRFPAVPSILIDMNLPGLNPSAEAPGSLARQSDDGQLVDALNRRRVEVSQQIAQVMERSSESDSPARRRELEAEYLLLINEFARLNARLRLVETAITGRRRR